MGGQSAPATTVIVNAPPGSSVEQQQRDTPNGREIEVTIKRVVAQDIRQGGTIADSLSQQFGLNRAYGTAR